MDQRLSEALQQSNYRAVLENQKEKLKELLESELFYSYSGGYFTLNAVLFLEIKMYLDENKEKAIILDLHQTPINIENLSEFYEESRSKYTESINRYQLELTKLISKRKIKDLSEFWLEDDNEE